MSNLFYLLLFFSGVLSSFAAALTEINVAGDTHMMRRESETHMALVNPHDRGNGTQANKYPHVRAMWAKINAVLDAKKCTKPWKTLHDSNIVCQMPDEGCTLGGMGKGWGQHAVCLNLIKKGSCNFISYGISRDYSFDSEMNNDYKCEGVGLDPTVDYPAKLPGTSVQFEKVAAPMLTAADTNSAWKVRGPLDVAKDMGFNGVTVLKMDCEGCEYALADQIKTKNPTFFDNVGQFAVEIHHDERFIKTTKHLDGYEALIAALDKAGLTPQQMDRQRCGKTGLKCIPELAATGYRCTLNCVNIVFARAGRTVQ